MTRLVSTVLVAAVLAAGCAQRKAIQGPRSEPPRRSAGAHRLLGRAQSAVYDAAGRLPATKAPKLRKLIPTLAAKVDREGAAQIKIDYPLEGSVFPPEIVPPTFLWHDASKAADTWLVVVDPPGKAGRICILTAGPPPPAGKIDARCVTKTNVHKPTAYQLSARSWTPSAAVWKEIKRRCLEKPTRVAIAGLASGRPERLISRGAVTLKTSGDPVGAPIFYRDVPLAPARGKQGKIMPLAEEHVPLIAWRLRDISRPESRVVLKDMPTCANCHSFSADGGVLAMDMDGPQRDKGAYAIVPLARRTVIRRKHVITWNSFELKPKGHRTLGLLSQISPDGKYALTTLNEEVYVANFMDFRFLQVFYVTRGILAYYSVETGRMKALPGADDPTYVHTSVGWYPDGKHIVFARARARPSYVKGRKPPGRANDPAETQIRYDLCRMPFNAGRGGKARMLQAARQDRRSNSMPKVSPDGRWIVFVKCRNGLLMRPDSKLWIMPAAGGKARLMRCNTPLMNSWHSWSPNSRWLVFSSKANTPYTQMFLTHIDEDGLDSPAILIPNSTPANRAVNLPEFVNIPTDGLVEIAAPAADYWRFLQRGYELAKAGKLHQALDQFRKGLALEPDHAEVHFRLGDTLAKLGRHKDGMAELRRAIELKGDHARAYDKLGVSLLQTGRPVDAVEHFRRAVALDPQFAKAYHNLGVALYSLARPREALRYLQRAVELDREYVIAYGNLAKVQAALGRRDEAVASLETALKLIGPDHPLRDKLTAQLKTYRQQRD